ncbi:hypothetical protein [Planococcus shixiaomingii]|uniref:hypothetical protein n=1 Tax=Planococcus shixiaomingii TaxID=3058393 RepID=UPI0026180F67|nr:hypothetical protein [Planococcus sp. N022]WKA56188.1 hypothetical protein QWY21_07550 [Planococcus sp. N022]
MKNDIRLNYPLWMMAFVALIGAFAYGIHSPTMTKTETSLMLEIGGLEGFVLLASLLLYTILLTVFLVKVTKHNKENPKQKLAIWSIRPPEYLEQDEGMTHITRVAVQKVYTFYTWSLPLLAAVVILFPLTRLMIIYGILALAFIQYLIYYLEIRKHFKEETE